MNGVYWCTTHNDHIRDGHCYGAEDDEFGEDWQLRPCNPTPSDYVPRYRCAVRVDINGARLASDHGGGGIGKPRPTGVFRTFYYVDHLVVVADADSGQHADALAVEAAAMYDPEPLVVAP